jgi:hypothetical protein
MGIWVNGNFVGLPDIILSGWLGEERAGQKIRAGNVDLFLRRIFEILCHLQLLSPIQERQHSNYLLCHIGAYFHAFL